mmetsp:Transcript_18329/g.43848  ORF Transcript_18329/g.43848 Transcript_18329/m.43848 type:complete len:259 (+) Transcript_18329:690-1466(+)
MPGDLLGLGVAADGEGVPLVPADLLHAQEGPLAGLVVEVLQRDADLENVGRDHPREELARALAVLVEAAEDFVQEEQADRPEGPLEERLRVEEEQRKHNPVERVRVPEDVKARDLLAEDLPLAAAHPRRGGQRHEDHAHEESPTRDAMVGAERPLHKPARGVVLTLRDQRHPREVHPDVDGNRDKHKRPEDAVGLDVGVEGEEARGGGAAEPRHEVAHDREEQQREHEVEHVAADLGERKVWPHGPPVLLVDRRDSKR